MNGENVSEFLKNPQLKCLEISVTRQKWRLEWSFFLGENGRRQYNKLCKGCVHPCKQSFRAVVVSCPHYLSLRSQKCRN